MLIRALTIVAVVALGIDSASAQVKIGLMVSATGPTTAIGIPQKNTGELLPKKIGDTTIEYIQLDDGGDTTRAVQNAKKLIGENNIDALIGPSTTPNALAILDIIAEARVPLIATVGTSSVDEAAYWFISMERTCQAQLLAEAAGTPHPIDPDQAEKTAKQVGSPLLAAVEVKAVLAADQLERGESASAQADNAGQAAPQDSIHKGHSQSGPQSAKGNC